MKSSSRSDKLAVYKNQESKKSLDSDLIARSTDDAVVSWSMTRAELPEAFEVVFELEEEQELGPETSDLMDETVSEVAVVSVASEVSLPKNPIPTPAPGYKIVRGDFSPANTDRTTLITEYAPLIKFIAQKIASRLPASIEVDDLVSSGVIGLMDAIDKYDTSRDNKFKTYAEFRIRGAILDELRSQDWVPRSVREKSKTLERAYTKLEQLHGRHASEDEVCAELSISKEDFHSLLAEVKGVSLLSFDDISNLSKQDKRSIHGYGDQSLQGALRGSNPFQEVNQAHMKQVLAQAITELPEKQRLVLSLYYYEDLNLKEIGRVLDVTESRVSQLHTQAVLKLKARLRSQADL